MKRKNALPRGFSYKTDEEVVAKNDIIGHFIKTRGPFDHIIEFPPVAFKEDFFRGAHIVGDKAFEFADKKGRELVLTPDSLAHVFNYYQHSPHNGQARYAWISPTFRYRHAPTRHFYQLGYTSLNMSGSTTEELSTGLQTLVEFLQSAGDPSTTLDVTIVHPRLLKSLCRSLVDTEEQLSTVYSFLKDNDRTRLEGMQQQAAIASLSTVLKTTDSTDAALKTALRGSELSDEVLGLVERLASIPGIHTSLNLSCNYAAEILSGVGCILEVGGKKIGDGGVYSDYGAQFHGTIRSVASLCTGVNPVLRMRGLL